MKRPKKDLIFEDEKLIITKDRWQFIVRKKPLPKGSKNAYKNATYIIDPSYVIWEVCDCRKVYKKSSKETQSIAKLVSFFKHP